MFDTVVPRGATPIGERLEDLMLYYLNELDAAKESGGVAAVKKLKPVNYIIITDGVPSEYSGPGTPSFDACADCSLCQPTIQPL